MKNKIKNVFKIIGCSCLAVLIALSCVIIPKKLSKNQRFLGTSLNSANAVTSIPDFTLPDSTIIPASQFYSSNVFLSLLSTTNQNIPELSDFSRLVQDNPNSIFSGDPFYNILSYSFSLSSSVSSSSRSIGFNIRAVMSNYDIITEYMEEQDMFNLINYSIVSDSSNVPNFPSNLNWSRSVRVSMYDGGSNFRNYSYIGVALFTNESLYKGQPNLDIQYVELLNSYSFESYIGFAPHFSNSNVVVYTDSNGWKYAFYIPSPFNAQIHPVLFQTYYLSYRKYYFDSAFNFNDNDYYQQGLSDGYTNGYNAGEQSGYTSGYNAGEQSGYTDGYNAGLNTAQTATFYSLIGAVFDAPLNTFTSLFNFEILGVNLLSFLSSILTLAIVIWLIKIALGGK